MPRSAGPHAAFLHHGVGRGRCRLESAVGAGANRRVTHAEVEQDRGRNNRDPRAAELVADAAPFEISHHPAGRFEPEGAAPRKQNCVHALDDVLG
jgi:hypothetical protein